MSAIQLWRYSIPSENGEGWAVFVLGSDGYFSACSDWGNYAFMWRSTGCDDFREFLLRADRDWDYFARKLAPIPVYDGEQTEKRVKQAILQRRRDRVLESGLAFTEWERLKNFSFSNEFEFHTWYLETELEDAGELAFHGTEPNAVQFVRKCMVRLIPLLKADLEAEK